MNEQTTRLIEQLAQKLGTTAEYLWSVLVAQAKVEAIIGIALVSSTILLTVLLIYLHNKFSKESNEEMSIYYDKEEIVIIPMVIGAITVFILIIASLCSIGTIITGLTNPEYWALKEVLNSIK